MAKKLNPNRKVTMTVREINKLKENATIRAVQITQLFPLMVLRDKYGFGSKRLSEYQKHYNDLWDAYNKGYLKLEDIANTIYEETGIKVGQGGL